MCKTILCSQHARRVKNRLKTETTDKHSSFDGLIQEDIDLSDIHLAVSKIMHACFNYKLNLAGMD